MSTDPDTPLPVVPAPHPLGLGTRAFAYVVLCAVSLGVLLLIQVRHGQGLGASLLLLGIGGGGLLTRFRLAPLLVVLLVALRRYFDDDARWHADNQQGTIFQVPDVLRSVAVLGYVIGHYRLQGLSRHIFPPDYRLAEAQRSIRPRARWSLWHRPQVERHRSVHAMTPLEEPLLILSLPLFALLGQLAWSALAQPRELLEWDPWVVRLAVALATLVLGMSIAAGLLGTWRRRRMTLAEAHVMMQDTLWRETRGEQRWFTRWLAWFWLKERERKEQP